MVEMSETALILNHATDRSLVILDEIGRGTATFDGLSIAWAVAEHLHDTIGCRTLFATHYHELTDLANTKQAVANYNVAVREWNEEIIFLHKILPGAADKSYGIQVARLAGLPKPVVERAKSILSHLELHSVKPEAKKQGPKAKNTVQDDDAQTRRAADGSVRGFLSRNAVSLVRTRGRTSFKWRSRSHDHFLDLSKESMHIPCMPQSTLTSKNQTTIPKAVVEALHLRPSDQLVYEIEADGRIILSAKTGTFSSVAARLAAKGAKGPTRTVEDMNAAVKAMAAKRMSRTRS